MQSSSDQVAKRSCAKIPFALLAVVTLLVSAVWADEPKQMGGTVLSIERKGTTAKLSIESYEGEKIDLMWSRAAHYVVEGKGDDKYFRPGVWVTTTARKTATAWYADGFKVYTKSKLVPGYLKNDQNEYDIVGSLTAYDKNSVTLSVGPFGPIRILLDNKALDNIKAAVESNEFVDVGANVEMEGSMRGKKFIPTKVTVKTEKVIPVDQAFSKKPINKPDASGKGTASKDKEGAADAKGADPKAKPEPKAKVVKGKKQPDMNMPNPDPFGALGNDPNPKGKGKKPNKK